MIDWSAIGTAAGGILIGIGSFLAGKSKRNVETAANAAETDVITMLRAEVARLSQRITALEGREGRLIRHVYRLEGLMAGAGLTPPPFEIDGGGIPPVGSVTPA
jgi:hypothetical protein